jgi:hypothetical protein
MGADGLKLGRAYLALFELQHGYWSYSNSNSSSSGVLVKSLQGALEAAGLSWEANIADRIAFLLFCYYGK